MYRGDSSVMSVPLVRAGGVAAPVYRERGGRPFPSGPKPFFAQNLRLTQGNNADQFLAMRAPPTRTPRTLAPSSGIPSGGAF